MIDSDWWRDSVVYEIYVRSFADSNGDGIGDLPGIRSRLPYLKDLGVDAVWLTPFYPSPMADGGYDVADYCDVDPMFGTLADFDDLVADIHRLGLRVIIDIVPNHSSNVHPWFQEALAARQGSAARARYHFRSGKGESGELPPNDWESLFGGSAWTRIHDGQWYLHLFALEQPDLNWGNPAVRAEFVKVLEFWLDRDVDGFRVDVAHGMVKRAGLPDVGRAGQAELLGREPVPYFDQEEVHQIHREWRAVLSGYRGDRIGVAEAWVETPARLARYVRADEMHQAFNFHVLEAEWSESAMREAILDSLVVTQSVGAAATWVLSNHDVVRQVTRYGGGERGLRRARAMALVTLALPGSVYLYQGDELGLPEVTDLPDEALQDPMWERSGRTERGRDGCRVPLPWHGVAPPFGFGPNGHASWLPMPADWAELAVSAQHGVPGTTLTLYRTALRLRREHPALGDGDVRWLPAPAEVLAFAREPGFSCAINMGSGPARLRLPGEVLCSSDDVPRGGDEFLLPPDTAVWVGTGRSTA